MKRITLGKPETLVPSQFCPAFCYEETSVSFNEEHFITRCVPKGFVVEWEMPADTHIYGFGLQLKQFDHTGHHLVMRVNADPLTPCGEGHAPVPFFATNKGYGMYFDTARYAEFSCGIKRPDGTAEKQECDTPATSTADLYAVRKSNGTVWMSVFIPVAKGVDVYVIEGDTITDIVSQYNRLSGGGPNVPEWSLGVMYRCCATYNAYKVRETARYFRDQDIPCDILGLEPGWQDQTYSCSYLWNYNNFPDPAALIKELRDMNFHINLWEHAFVHPRSPIYEELIPYSGDYGVWNGLVPDFAMEKAKDIFANYHRDAMVKLGVDGFKLDECDSSDNTGGWSFPLYSTFPSGLDGEQYHSLFGTLYIQAIQRAMEYKATLSQVRNLGALAASYPFVLYSDLYDHCDFVRGTVTSGFSGLLWSPEVRHADSKKDLIRRLQSVVFSAQCLINAWYCEEVPWKIYDCEDEVRNILKLRHALLPRLKEAFDIYHTTGKPPARALVMDFTDDEQTYNIDDEYMFGEDLLVAPIIGTESDEREVYLPNGKWVDFFTNQPIAAGRFTVCTEGIPVYRKIG